MANEIRFSELTRFAGQPKTITLWTNPARDKSFMKAVKENRVLTIIQTPHGGHKDFGQIGFHKQPMALYLVFSKKLPNNPKARIVGVKYDLIQEPEVKDPAKIVTPKGTKFKEPETEAVKQFQVVIKRTAVWKLNLRVEAENKAVARKRALEITSKQKSDLADAEVKDKIESVRSVIV